MFCAKATSAHGLEMPIANAPEGAVLPYPHAPEAARKGADPVPAGGDEKTFLHARVRLWGAWALDLAGGPCAAAEKQNVLGAP